MASEKDDFSNFLQIIEHRVAYSIQQKILRLAISYKISNPMFNHRASRSLLRK